MQFGYKNDERSSGDVTVLILFNNGSPLVSWQKHTAKQYEPFEG